MRVRSIARGLMIDELKRRWEGVRFAVGEANGHHGGFNSENGVRCQAS